MPDERDEHGGLHAVEHAAVGAGGQGVGRRHGRRHLRERRAQVGRDLAARGDGQAHLRGEAVRQTAQGRRHLGVGGADAGVAHVVGTVAVERDVRRPTQQTGRVGHDGQVRRVRRVEPVEQGGGREQGLLVAGPGTGVDPQRPRPLEEAPHVARVGLGQRAQQAHAGVEHEAGGHRAGEQRDLRVPVVRLAPRAPHRPPPVGGAVVGHDLLVGQAQLEGTSLDASGPAQPADVGQGLDARVQASGVGVRLHRGVVEAGHRAHERELHVVGDDDALAVEVDRPQRGAAHLVGQEAERALGQQRRVERHAAVGEVDGLSAAPRLHVDRTPELDDAEVGDRVVHAEPVAAAFEVHGLVEVEGARRVDGDEREVRPVGRRPRSGDDDALGLGEDLVGERVGAVGGRQVELAAERFEHVGDATSGTAVGLALRPAAHDGGA